MNFIKKPFVLGLILLSQNMFAQEHPVRFAIASFQVDGANDDLVRRLRLEVENQLFEVVDKCNSQMEFLIDMQNDAIDYLENINIRYQREYGIKGSRIPIPNKGNYIVMVRFEPGNNGVYLQIGVFARNGSSILYVGHGIAETDQAINTLYQAANRKEFIAKAMKDAFPEAKLRKWIEKETGKKVKMEDCFQRTYGHSPPPQGNIPPLNKSCEIEKFGGILIKNLTSKPIPSFSFWHEVNGRKRQITQHGIRVGGQHFFNKVFTGYLDIYMIANMHGVNSLRDQITVSKCQTTVLEITDDYIIQFRR